jgi:transcriptional regulator
MPTLRQEIAEALERDWLYVREISKTFHLREREVLGHLEHIARSASHGRFVIEPASCFDCGFVFRKRTRVSTPGRCPLCRSASVSSPRFRIK